MAIVKETFKDTCRYAVELEVGRKMYMTFW